MKQKIHLDKWKTKLTLFPEIVHEFRGITTFLYSNNNNYSDFYLFRVTTNKFSSSFYPFILVEYTSNCKVIIDQVQTLENISKLTKLDKQFIIKNTIDKQQPNQVLINRINSVINDELCNKYTDVKRYEISVICAIHQTKINRYNSCRGK